MTLQRLSVSDLILTRIKIRDCKLGTIAHTEKRLITIARVLYLAAIKIKGDIATALVEKNLFVVDNVLRQLEAGLFTRSNNLKLIAELVCASYFLGIRSSPLVFRSRNNGFTIRSRCTLILLLFLGLSLKLGIVASLATLSVVANLVFGVPAVGVFYISRLS